MGQAVAIIFTITSSFTRDIFNCTFMPVKNKSKLLKSVSLDFLFSLLMKTFKKVIILNKQGNTDLISLDFVFILLTGKREISLKFPR